MYRSSRHSSNIPRTREQPRFRLESLVSDKCNARLKTWFSVSYSSFSPFLSSSDPAWRSCTVAIRFRRTLTRRLHNVFSVRLPLAWWNGVSIISNRNITQSLNSHCPLSGDEAARLPIKEIASMVNSLERIGAIAIVECFLQSSIIKPTEDILICCFELIEWNRGAVWRSGWIWLRDEQRNKWYKLESAG